MSPTAPGIASNLRPHSFDRWTRRSLVLLAVAAISVLGLGEPQLSVAQSPPRLFGCDIDVLNLNRTASCLQGVIDREVRDAQRTVQAVADAQASRLQHDIDELQKDVANADTKLKIEIAKGEARVEAVQKQLAGPFYAQLEWQRTLLTEIKKQEALVSCLGQSASSNIQNVVNGYAANESVYIAAQIAASTNAVISAIPAVMKTELDRLAAGQPPSAAERTAQIHRGTELMLQFAQPIPGARCLMQTIPTQLRAQLEGSAAGVLTSIETQMRAVMNERIVPPIRFAIASQMRDGLLRVAQTIPTPVPTLNQALEDRVPFLQGLTLTEREMRAVARGVLLERQYTIAFRSGGEALLALTEAVSRADSTAQALAQAQQRVATALRPTNDWPQLYSAIGVELMRAVGHKYIDSDKPGHGGFLLNAGTSVLQLSEGSIEKIASALCGLIPEAGAAACAIYEEAISAAWNSIVVPQLQAELSRMIHVLWDQSIDKVRSELAAGRTLNDIRTRLGPADAMVAALPAEAVLHAWANGFIDADARTYDGYANAVVALTNAAIRR